MGDSLIKDLTTGTVNRAGLAALAGALTILGVPLPPGMTVIPVKARTTAPLKTKCSGIQIVVADESPERTKPTTISVPVAIHSDCSVAVVEPSGSVEFGNLEHNSTATQQLTVRNNGSFPFAWKFVLPADSDVDQAALRERLCPTAQPSAPTTKSKT